MSNKRVRVGILGATGMVGQRFVQMLEHHPEFEITALAASDRSQGKSYGEACTWRLVGDMPAFVKAMVVQPPQPPLDCDVVVSSLPSDVARSSEEAFARAGYPVISNASSFRMDEDVPLLIPEINSDHLKVLDRQKSERGFSTGYIVTNPNCSTIIMALALAPLHAKFGIEAVIATTLQAVSGAGYPGVPSLDVVDNVLPFIDGEEPKMESETRKILGRLGNNSFRERAVRRERAMPSRECGGRPHGGRARKARQARLDRRSSRGARNVHLGSSETQLAHRAETSRPRAR